MKVFINDEEVNCSENTSLSHFIQQQNIDTSHIAVAVNDSVILRKNWESTILTEGCRILIIQATQGG